jgi:ribosomal protein S27AE
MTPKRLSLIHYDVVRDACERCGGERFLFVPIGTLPAPGLCKRCGSQSRLADLSDSAICRLVMQPDGEVEVVPVIG